MCIFNFVFILATLSDVFGETVYLVPERGYESVRPDLSLERRNFERRSYLDSGSRNENFGTSRSNEFRYNLTPPPQKEFAARRSKVSSRSRGKNEEYYKGSETYTNFQLNDNSRDYNFNSQERFTPNTRQSFPTFNARVGEEREFDSNRRPTHNPQKERHPENPQNMYNSSREYNDRQSYQNTNVNDDRYYSNKQNERGIEIRYINNHNEQTPATTHSNKKTLFISRIVPEPNTKGLNNSKFLEKNGTVEGEVNWVWGSEGESDAETTTDSLGDRVALVGDKCPTGLIRVGGKCVEPV